MKGIFLSVMWLPFFLLVISCNNVTTQEPENQSTHIDQNMFGQGIPRGVTIHHGDVVSGYLMMAVPSSASTYLIDRAGQVVFEWKGNYSEPNDYLMDDGSLVRMALDPDFPVFAGGGESGRIQRISWEGKMLWDFEFANEEHHAHHDIAVMPNGNILAIAWESKSAKEAIEAGRRPERTPKAGLWPDMVVEIQPEGMHGGTIIWEWHMWDHLVQDADEDLPDYGQLKDHPELFDINLGAEIPAVISQDSLDKLRAQDRLWRNENLDNRGSDAFHTNAINYNADLDQIALSSYHLNEIIIIDHSTTSDQAKGHVGGRWGKGGDILYRWGNPQNYDRGDSTDQQTFHQHDIKWIENGKPGAGNLMLFNNNIPGNPDSLHYSAVFEIIPPKDAGGNYLIEQDKSYGPEKPTWTYTAPDSISFWSGFISGAHRMENGNTFITEGARGRIFEVTSQGEIVWEFLNPYRGNVRKLNGDPINPMPMTWSLFRATFIPITHPAFVGKSLSPLDPQPEVFQNTPPPK